MLLPAAEEKIKKLPLRLTLFEFPFPKRFPTAYNNNDCYSYARKYNNNDDVYKMQSATWKLPLSFQLCKRNSPNLWVVLPLFLQYHLLLCSTKSEWDDRCWLIHIVCGWFCAHSSQITLTWIFEASKMKYFQRGIFDWTKLFGKFAFQPFVFHRFIQNTVYLSFVVII